MLTKLVIILFGCLLVVTQVASADKDEFLWLENVEGKAALDWVERQNSETDESLGADPLYASLYNDALSALNSKDKLPSITIKGDWLYNLYKSEDHPRGIYRRTKPSDFAAGSPKWQTVLDIDKLSRDEGEKWVFHGMDCLKPNYQKCFVELSPGGGDANELREFDINSFEFLDDGFTLPTSKMSVSWMDEDHLFVATDFGSDTMTESGYPRMIKVWKRGTSLEKAEPLFQTGKESVRTFAQRYRHKQSNLDLIVESLSFWTNRYHQLLEGEIVPLQLPESAVLEDVLKGELVIKLQQDWSFKGAEYKQGSVLLVALSVLRGGKGSVTVLAESTPQAIIEEVSVTDDAILLVVLQDVKSSVYRYTKAESGWVGDKVALPNTGQVTIETTNESSGEFFARYEGFLTPPTLYAVDKSLQVSIALQQSATFDATDFKVEQHFVSSLDGTKVPYFVVMNKGTKFDGKNPTHIFSYGGFRATLTPSYSGSYEDLNGAYGKMWLQRGGVFVLANIRGGGEYGPAWHAAALLENRHKAFEDFEAVAEDLINRKITSPQHLGIEGRSNGGLLVGATMVRRPDLYGAIICGVPLLDMQRYHTLLAGASWMAEYGNPDTDDWQFIKSYSPYQNVREDVDYPPVFFFTSTRDDRVHPGHARKMVAKMAAQGHDVEYYENTEGGHKGSSTSEQLAKRIALGYTHLWRSLK